MRSDSLNIRHKVSLAFGNDMSRIVRGMAIIFMVTNHSMPGKINAFAVPLFSFLVGYGYNFARERSLRHGFKRIWHLLKSYWLVLFGICLPVALISYPYPLKVDETILAAFGLNGTLNFFSWYVYFYIFAMLVMPWVSILLDKAGMLGWINLIVLCSICGISVFLSTDVDPENMVVAKLSRCFNYMPIVMTGYFIASRNLFAKLKYYPGATSVMLALVAMIYIYLLRGWDAIRVIDCLWAPMFAGATAILFRPPILAPIRFVLTELGLKSMYIWFLHALFFTHATKGVFGVLTSWIQWPWLFILVVLALSYVMGALLDGFLKWIPTLRVYLPSFKENA